MRINPVAIAVVVIAIAFWLMVIGVMGGFVGPIYNRSRINRFVINNEELLNNAVAEILELDGHVSHIAHTRFSGFHRRDELGFAGLYTGGVIGSRYVVTPLDNPILYELLQNGRIRGISIARRNFYSGPPYHIQFSFEVGGFWDRYGGIYFSRNDRPMSFSGGTLSNPEEYRNGWVTYGFSFYYTERIVPHWFYYERVANSTRTPRR